MSLRICSKKKCITGWPVYLFIYIYLFIYLTKNVRNAELTKSHLAVVQEIVTNERYDSEGVFNDVAENWLDLILKGAV